MKQLDTINLSYQDIDTAIKELQALKERYKGYKLEIGPKICECFCDCWDECYCTCNCTTLEVTGVRK